MLLDAGRCLAVPFNVDVGFNKIWLLKTDDILAGKLHHVKRFLSIGETFAG